MKEENDTYKEEKCPNCGATENNWKKQCSACKVIACYLCIDEHECVR